MKVKINHTLFITLKEVADIENELIQLRAEYATVH